jgi:hypothetical protein
MNKMAVFVEGQTEQIFVEKLLREIAGEKNLRIELRLARGGAKTKRRIRQLRAAEDDSGQEFFVLIVDCGADSRVASDVREQYESLVKAGYTAIVGVRDVYPQPRAAIPHIVRLLNYGQKTIPIQVVFVLAVMEIETWFITEHDHFSQIDLSLTPAFIHARVGFNPETDDIEQRPHPAQDLHDIYALVGMSYTKDRSTVQNTVNCLNYARLYLELPDRYASLKTLVDSIDSFLN